MSPILLPSRPSAALDQAQAPRGKYRKFAHSWHLSPYNSPITGAQVGTRCPAASHSHRRLPAAASHWRHPAVVSHRRLPAVARRKVCGFGTIPCVCSVASWQDLCSCAQHLNFLACIFFPLESFWDEHRYTAKNLCLSTSHTVVFDLIKCSQGLSFSHKKIPS